MSKKLLTKTLRVYLFFSVIVLFISAPLFYLLADKLFIDDADETLLLRKKEFAVYHQPFLKVNDIWVWSKFNRDVKIEANLFKIKRDSIFYSSYLDTLANENEPYRVLLSPVSIEGKPFVLAAQINLVESEDMIRGIAVLFVLILIILLAGLYFITRMLSKRLWEPFYFTLGQVESFELDKNTKTQFIPTDVEEFSRLNQSVSKLFEKNSRVYKSQKEFIENASHELQTPLALFRAKLDALAQQLPFTEEIGKTLSVLNDAVTRLTRINKNLLLLSKIENDHYSDTDQFSINGLLEKQVAFLMEQADETDVAVRLIANEPLPVQANAALLEIAISNLLLNALRHNRRGGNITIACEEQTLKIANTSNAAALDTTKLFQRFANTQSTGGNGLGLAIVKKVADMHGWRLEYKFDGEMHIFLIIF